MAFETTSFASSSSQSVDAPKELLLVLNMLNEKQKLKYTQRKEQEMEQQQPYQHLQYHYQHHDQQQHKQQQLEESKRECEQRQQQQQQHSQQYTKLSQIELIYRAEGNANLVLALPQFKKVLRLPKTAKQHEEQKQLAQKPQYQESTESYQKHLQQHHLAHEKLKEQNEMNQQEPNTISTTGQQQNKSDAVGILTMDHYVAYISIIRCLVGNEFVFEADIVAVPNPNDRHWINEHIKPYRPANRLDKEFGGHFGLLLPDATQLPAVFDILFSNLQSKSQSATTVTTATKTSHCSNSNSSSRSSNNTDNSYSVSNNIFGSDTFAIEIKPKQGWLLPNDVNNLFDIKPRTTQITRATQPPSLCETKTTLKPAIATTQTETQVKPLKASTDIECFTTTQNEPSQTTMPASAATTTSQTEVAMTSRCCYDSMSSRTLRDDKISHSLYDKVDTRCRYCCMQFLKMKQQKIVKRNQYCPIDLFSGNTVKMFFALQALFECPQNNLRIFQNGDLVFDDKISTTSTIEDLFSSDKLQLIKHLLVTCLLREYDSKAGMKKEANTQINKETKQQLLAITEPIANEKTIWDADGRDGEEGGASSRAGVVATGQPQSSVTSCKKQKLSTMPKTKAATTTTLMETEVTKVKSTLTSAAPIFSMTSTSTSTSDYCTRRLEQINKAEVTCLPKNCVLQKVLHLQSFAKTNLQFMLDHGYADKTQKTYNIVSKLLQTFAKTKKELTLCQLSPEEQYILAATILDCSIMITFSEIENVEMDEEEMPKGKSLIDNPSVVSIFGKTFLTKVTLLDLDPKPDAHFNKYLSQTKQIVDALKEL